jgi:uncharacterized protein (DUF169 family)
MTPELATALRSLDEAVSRYVRPDTFPLTIRMIRPGEPLPEGVKVPSQSMGEQWIVCQSIGVARRYGWSIAVGRQDLICPLAAIAFGFRRPNPAYQGGFVSIGMYCKDEQAASNLEASTWHFEPGAYEYVCIAPLSRANFEPDVIALYGNSAQVMRLVHASLYARGGRLVSTTSGRLDCAELIIQTLNTGEPKVVLPCNGDRVFGMAQDYEMAFAFPWSWAAEIVRGLEGTHKGGTRYPITVAMRDTVTMPKSYQELMKMLDEQDDAAGKS